jgi:hypothetical protein
MKIVGSRARKAKVPMRARWLDNPDSGGNWRHRSTSKN